MTYRTLVFDFDGTIADTLGETRRIFNVIAPDYGIRQVEEHEIHQLRHLSLKQLLDHLDIPKRRVPALISRGTGLMRGNITSLQMIDGMTEVLTELRRHVHSFGILTSNAADAELHVQDSEFGRAPAGTSLPHLLYVGRIARFTLLGSRFSGGRNGHLVKSRARESTLRFDSREIGEIEFL